MLRRSFLRCLSAGAGAVPFLPEVLQTLDDRLGRLAADLESTSRQEDYWSRVRQEFQLNPGLIHLNCGSLGATPSLVTDALATTMREMEGDPATKVFSWGPETMETVRARAGAFIGADTEEVAFTRNTTEAMNAVATGIDLERGDQILTTNHEHGGGMTCWQYLRKRRGVEVVYLTMPRMVKGKEEILDRVRDHITPRTKVCSFSDIETINGVRMPLAELAAITRPRGIILVCDGAQVPGMLPVDVKALGVDTYAYSGHKWLLAPKGSGLLYIRKGIQDRIQPAFLHSGYEGYTASGGTRGVARIVGHGASLDFHDTIGKERIESRCRELSAYLKSRLEGVPGLETLTPTDPQLSGALLTVALRRGNSGEVRKTLADQYRVLVKAAQGTYAYCEEEGLPRENYNAIRFSTHIFNDEVEIDRGVEAFKRVLAEA